MKRKKNTSDPEKLSAEKQSYVPTARELSAIRTYRERRAAEATPKVKVRKDGQGVHITLDHPDEAIGSVLLSEALGAADTDFTNGLLGQLVNASSDRGINERGLSFMLSVIKGIQPKDQLEAMLAAQMAAIHMATMTFARRLAHVENIPQQDSAERALNKLARTYAGQMEALKRYRTGGEQKVTVQHVSVTDGGQAIVGNVTHTGRQTVSDEETPRSSPAITHAQQVPIESIAEKEAQAPVPRRATKK